MMDCGKLVPFFHFLTPSEEVFQHMYSEMSGFVSSTHQKILNRRRRIDSSVDGNECLDLSIKDFYFIIYYSDSDPGKEYEILSEKDLEDSWNTLEKGASVVVKFGSAKIQGIVVTVSDDLEYLKANFQVIIEDHQESISEQKFKAKQSFSFPENRTPYIKRHVVKVTDKETQTEQIHSEVSYCSDVDYVELKKKYQELKQEFDRLTLLFGEVKSRLEDTMTKLDNFKTSDDGHSTTSSSSLEDNKENVDSFNKMIQIGSQGTKIPKNVYDSINWASYTTATRKLLITLFPRKILATHSLTGKPSPAFLTRGKKTKMRLTPSIISDIVELISKNCKVTESLVRNAITTKCADENKLYRKRLQKKRGSDVETDDEDMTNKM